MGISLAYHLCVAPDHDTFESSIVNSIETKREQERQGVAPAAKGSSSSSGSNSNSSSSRVLVIEQGEQPSIDDGSDSNHVEEAPREQLPAGGATTTARGAGVRAQVEAGGGGGGAGANSLVGRCAPSHGSDTTMGFGKLVNPAAGAKGSNKTAPTREGWGDDWGEVQVRSTLKPSFGFWRESGRGHS